MLRKLLVPSVVALYAVIGGFQGVTFTSEAQAKQVNFHARGESSDHGTRGSYTRGYSRRDHDRDEYGRGYGRGDHDDGRDDDHGGYGGMGGSDHGGSDHDGDGGGHDGDGDD